MGSLFIVIARVLIVAPLLVSAVLALLDYGAASAAFSEAYPRLAGGFPAVIGVKALVALILVAGLPLHRVLALLMVGVVLVMASVQAPFWHFIGAEREMMLAVFSGALAQAGGLLLIAVMPKS